MWLIGYSLLIGMPKVTTLLLPLIMISFLPILLGLGWLLSAIGVVVKDIGQLTSMINHTLLFLTPIFYSVDAAPPLLQKALLLNPLTFVVEQIRLILFYGQRPVLKNVLVYFILSSFFAWVSLLIFRRLRPVFADMV